MTNLESNTRARRVEPLILERWAAVSPEGEIMEKSLLSTKDRAQQWCDLVGDYTVRKVKLTIEVVE